MSKRGTAQILRTLVFLGASTSYINAIQTPALGQDWKPGDPINFGAAHKSMFDSSTPAGAPGSSRVLSPGTTSGASPSAGVLPGTNAASGAQPSAMDNFLNSRTIEWKPGDPIPFGAAHRTPSNNISGNKSINGDNSQSLTGAVPATTLTTPPVPPGGLQGIAPAGTSSGLAQPALSGLSPQQPPSSVIGAANAPLQDLSPAPSSFGSSVGGAVTAGVPTSMPVSSGVPNVPGVPGVPGLPGAAGFSSSTGWGGTLPPTNASHKKSKASKSNKNDQNKQNNQSKQNNQKSDSSGNIFSHAFHWMGDLFGGNK
jgi:hypothetical protein